MFPRFKTNRARVVYALLRRLYFVLLCAYVPALFVLSAIVDLGSKGGFFQIGFWLPFMLLSIFSLPIFLGLMLIGVLIHHSFCVKTGCISGRPARVGTLCYSLSLVCVLLTSLSAILYTENVLPALSFIGLCVFCFAGAILFVCCHSYLRRTANVSDTEEEPSPRLKTYKRVLTVVVVVVMLLSVVLTPYSTVHYDDGGTVKLQALGYAVVKWDRKWDMGVEESAFDYENEPQKTRLYLFPDNFKGYEELWRLKH